MINHKTGGLGHNREQEEDIPQQGVIACHTPGLFGSRISGLSKLTRSRNIEAPLGFRIESLLTDHTTNNPRSYICTCIHFLHLRSLIDET